MDRFQVDCKIYGLAVLEMNPLSQGASVSTKVVKREERNRMRLSLRDESRTNFLRRSTELLFILAMSSLGWQYSSS